MKTNDVVTPVATTLKGQNRIREHGSNWRIIILRENGALLESELTGYQKWAGGDWPDFWIDLNGG